MSEWTDRARAAIQFGDMASAAMFYQREIDHLKSDLVKVDQARNQFMIDLNAAYRDLEVAREELNKWRGPTCGDPQCSDYDGNHPYHQNALERGSRQAQDKLRPVIEQLEAQRSALAERMRGLYAQLRRRWFKSAEDKYQLAHALNLLTIIFPRGR